MKHFQIPILKTVITPSNPPTGFLKLYFKSDGKLYSLNDAGVETDLSAGWWWAVDSVNWQTGVVVLTAADVWAYDETNPDWFIVDISWQDLSTADNTVSWFVNASQAEDAAPIQSVTGTAVDNTDPANPVINTTGWGGWITFNAITTDTNAVADNGYIVNGSGIIEVTLPTTCAVGKQIEIVWAAAHWWILAQNAWQIVHFGVVTSTTWTGGSMNSTQKRDSIRLVCTVADTEFQVISSVGNINVV